MKVKWKSEGEGYWVSECGRFSIVPLFYGRTTAQGYNLKDTITKQIHPFDRVRDCKEWVAKMEK